MAPITIKSGWAVWLAVGAGSLAATAGSAGVQLTVRTETVLARPTILAVEQEAVFSEDARHVAYPVGGREQRVCLDGVEGPGFEMNFKLAFDGPSRIRLLAQRRGAMGRKEWAGVELEIADGMGRAATN